MAIISRSKLWKKKLGDWVINPYVGCEHGCKHCYCPTMPGVKFLNYGHTQREWGNYIFPKKDLLERLDRELKRFDSTKGQTSWGKGYVLLSFLTDCYSPIESKLKLTRQILIKLLEHGHFVRIQTRSALVERDFDVIKSYPDQVLIGTSLPYLNNALSRVLEPGASLPSRRIKMLQKADDCGIRTYVAIAPVMPFHGFKNLQKILDVIKPLRPYEIFSEVLNPMDENIAMMNEALKEASQPEFISEDYRKNVWVRWTYDYLYKAYIEAKRQNLNFICWPSPHTIKSPLTLMEQQWLRKWLPSYPN